MFLCVLQCVCIGLGAAGGCRRWRRFQYRQALAEWRAELLIGLAFAARLASICPLRTPKFKIGVVALSAISHTVSWLNVAVSLRPKTPPIDRLGKRSRTAASLSLAIAFKLWCAACTSGRRRMTVDGGSMRGLSLSSGRGRLCVVSSIGAKLDAGMPVRMLKDVMATFTACLYSGRSAWL